MGVLRAFTYVMLELGFIICVMVKLRVFPCFMVEFRAIPVL